MNEKKKILKRKLGNTEIEVTPIGLGMMEFGGGGGLLGAAFSEIDQAEKNAIVQAGLTGGINWFDTAEIYGSGVSESSLATALHAASVGTDEVIIATKWWPLFRTAGNIHQTINARLHYLDGFPIGLYMVHQPFGLSSPEKEMDAMAELVKKGLIHSIGVSNFNPENMHRAYLRLQEHGLSLAVNQVHYSLLNRSIETDGTLELARKLGVTIIAYTPLEFGLLSGKYHKHPELLLRKPIHWRIRLQAGIRKSRDLIAALEEIANQYTVTPAQIA